MKKYDSILAAFGIDPSSELSPLGNGLINDTFLVCPSDTSEKYVLQRINTSIFPDPDSLQDNIEKVTAHIRHRLETEKATDIDRHVLHFLQVRSTGKTWMRDEKGDVWRVSVFIPDSVTPEKVDEESSYLAGKAFGNFQSMLSDIPDKLTETIPGFHDMELRLAQFRQAVSENKAGRAREVRDIIEEIERRADDMCLAEQLHRKGLLPKRVCHCDTKVNNMLFDKNGDFLCVIDLDTVMPSYIFSDYGDFLRTAANTAPEDEPDLNKIEFRMPVFKAFTRGYLESATFLTDSEKENLPFAVTLFPFMQAVRFLTDYLNGDTYYRIKYPDHNLVRTKAQMDLFHKAEACISEMKDYIMSIV